jgi:hypothetical protein
MTIQPSECSVFIQIWVDTNALQNGSEKGVYLVDNNVNHGSSSEGTTSLDTVVSTNAKVCWSLQNVDPKWQGALSIQNFSDAAVFGASGTPTQVDGTTWTGQAECNGESSYSIKFNVQAEGGSGITTTVNPTLTVQNK